MPEAAPARGLFITLEGGEGTGKSTLLAALMRDLSERGHDCVRTREPGGSVLAEKVRDLVLHPPGSEAWTPLAQALLMNAARADHIRTLIAPALAAGQIVLCDRFADSTRVYQGVCGGVPLQTLISMESAVLASTRPDLTLILDAPVDLTQTRRATRGVTDAFERQPAEFHNKVRDGFRAIAADEPQRCHLIDAALPPQDVLRAALAVIVPLFEPAR
jgi:dTMP kinase